MAISVDITLTQAGDNLSLFDLYSNVDNYTIPFDTDVSVEDLLSGYTVLAPNFTEIIRVKSKGECVNFIDIIISQNYPICPTQLVITGLQEEFFGYTGVYDRLYSYSGGSFTFVYRNPFDNWVFDTPDINGLYGVAYGRNDGTNYYTIHIVANPVNNLSSYVIRTNVGDYAIGNVGGGFIVGGSNFEVIDNVAYPSPGIDGAGRFRLSYPAICP